ncbi:MAG: ATP-binding protein [Solirubrobacterales bacterium]
MAYTFERHALPLVDEALGYARVVLLLGPRQAGKSTLLHELERRGTIGRTLTLDDNLTRQAALADPTGFAAGLDRPVAIDEVQRAPDLLLAIKQIVDRDDSPGQFLLTGSANVLTAPRILDALTGRTDMVVLWPLAQTEIEGSTSNLVDHLFDMRPPAIRDAPVGPAAWVQRAVLGGFPEVRTRPPGRLRSRWFEAYLASLVQRDLRELSDVQKLEEMPRLIRVLAAQAAGILVPDRLSQRVGLNARTIRSYVGLLETVFAVRVIPAWRPGITARERLAPKLLFADTGMLAHLLGARDDRAASDPQVVGKLYESFVASEISKLLTWAEHQANPYHYRRERNEVDLVLEGPDGAIVAIEAKASASFGASDRRSLLQLRDALGERFRAGVILHTGAETVPIGERLWALPVSALWQSGV